MSPQDIQKERAWTSLLVYFWAPDALLRFWVKVLAKREQTLLIAFWFFGGLIYVGAIVVFMFGMFPLALIGVGEEWIEKQLKRGVYKLSYGKSGLWGFIRGCVRVPLMWIHQLWKGFLWATEKFFELCAYAYISAVMYAGGWMLLVAGLAVLHGGAKPKGRILKYLGLNPMTLMELLGSTMKFNRGKSGEFKAAQSDWGADKWLGTSQEGYFLGWAYETVGWQYFITDFKFKGKTPKDYVQKRINPFSYNTGVGAGGAELLYKKIQESGFTEWEGAQMEEAIAESASPVYAKSQAHRL